jgi:hypothetical protein
MAHDPGRPVRGVFIDCHDRREIAIAKQKSHQNKIAKLLFVAQPSRRLRLGGKQEASSQSIGNLT